MAVRRWARGVVAAVFVVAVLAVGHGTAEAGAVPPPFIRTWGTSGSGSGQFNAPMGVAVAPNGNVYVADRGNHRVQVFSSSGSFVGSGGSFGSLDGQFSLPTGVAVAPNGNVYVADTGNNRVQVFNSTGGFVTTWGSAGTGAGEFASPSGVAVAPSGYVYVADSGNHRVQVFDLTGAFQFQWGSFGALDGELNGPFGIAVAPDGAVYVADTGNNRIQAFDLLGEFLTAWGSQGGLDGQFAGPSGVAVAPDGNVVVADTFIRRVQVFTPSGAFVTKWGASGSAEGEFEVPRGVAVAPNGQVVVADTGNNRVQVFGREPSLTATMTGPPVVMVGQEIFYELSVTNTGNVALTGLRAVDAEAPDCSRTFGGSGNVAVGATTSFLCSYPSTAEDVGVFRNSAYLTSDQHTLHATNVVRTRVVTPRPDVLIRPAGATTYVGGNVYNATGAGQTVTRSAARGTTASFDVNVTNDSAATDSFTVRAAGASRTGYTVTYSRGATDITAQVVAGTYAVDDLAPGGSVVIKARVRVGSTAAAGSSVSRTVSVTSTTDPTVKDAVKATVTRA